MNKHRFARLHSGTRHKHVPRRDCHQRQGRRFFPTELRGLWKDVNARNGEQFSVTSIAPITNNVVLAAKVVVSTETRLAMSTGNTGLDHYFIPGLDPRDHVADLLRNTGNIISENMRQRNLNSRQSPA